MPVDNILTPREAAYIATNAYFSLKNWINSAPVAGVESRAKIHNRVLGAGNAGSNQPAGGANPSLKSTDLRSSSLASVHSAQTGLGTVSGFGYTLSYRDGSRSHAIIAMRGTRAEYGAADLVTDARGAITVMGGVGPVHKGFKRTFDSVGPSLQRDGALIGSADIVHVVGHSLGGAVATLIAAHYAARGKAVRLYTFGSPRVGAFGAHEALERAIGKNFIFRVAHDLDPVSLLGPFPYLHVNGAATDRNNMTLPSPTGSLFTVANHDMTRYIDSVGDRNWDGVRTLGTKVNHDNCALANWLLRGDNPGWLQVASAHTLGLLFKLFSHVLGKMSSTLIMHLTAIDFMAEILVKGLYMAKDLADKVRSVLGYAAVWAGLQIQSGAQFTARIVSIILSKMISTVSMLTGRALAAATTGLVPIPLVLGSSFLLTGCGPL